MDTLVVSATRRLLVMAFRVVPDDTALALNLVYYREDKLSAEEIIAKRSAKDPQLAAVAPEASRVLRQLLSGVSTTTDEPYVVGYFIQSGFVDRNVDGWSPRSNWPNRIFPGPEKPPGPPYPMPEATFPGCRCQCKCQPRCITVACPGDKVRIHQRIKHYYRGKDDFINWVELICLKCNMTRAFIPEYMAEKDSIISEP